MDISRNIAMCTRVIILVITILNVAASRTLPLRVMPWNVYWKALDDAHGQAAIVNAIDSADQSGDVKYSFAAIRRETLRIGRKARRRSLQ